MAVHICTRAETIHNIHISGVAEWLNSDPKFQSRNDRTIYERVPVDKQLLYNVQI